MKENGERRKQVEIQSNLTLLQRSKLCRNMGRPMLWSSNTGNRTEKQPVIYHYNICFGLQAAHHL